MYISLPQRWFFFGIPVLHSYYQAAQLNVPITYLQPSNKQNWAQIEESIIIPYMIRDILWKSPLERLKSYLNNPFLKLS